MLKSALTWSVVLALTLPAPAAAQLGQNAVSVSRASDQAEGDLPDPLAAVLAARDSYGRSPRITIVDNTFMGISGLKDLRDRFEEAGWDAKYEEDTFVSGFFDIAQNTDVLYIVTHGGVRQSDQQVGFVWRTLFGLNKNVLTADVVAERMSGQPHPALVIVAGCQTTANDSMARAFGGAYMGFGTAVNPATAATWCRGVLEKIADGQTYREAFSNTPPISSWMNTQGGLPRLIEPLAEE